MKKLNTLLADIAVLTQKTYTLHWNVKGSTFLPWHKQTEVLYEGLTKFYDEVGEKIKMFGLFPLASLAEIIKSTTIKELKAKDYKEQELIKIVIEDLNSLEKTLCSIPSNKLFQPLFDELIMFIDKQRWLFKQGLND